METRLAELEARLARAERRSRMWAAAALAMGVMGLAMVARPSASQEPLATMTRVRAPFAVVDSRGRKLLTVSERIGFRGVEVWDAQRKPVAATGVITGTQSEIRGLSVYDSQGGMIAHTGIRGDERGIETFGTDGKEVTELGVAGDEHGLLVFGANEQRAAKVVFEPADSEAEVAVYNTAATKVGELDAKDDNKAGLIKLKDSAGNLTFQAP